MAGGLVAALMIEVARLLLASTRRARGPHRRRRRRRQLAGGVLGAEAAEDEIAGDGLVALPS